MCELPRVFPVHGDSGAWGEVGRKRTVRTDDDGNDDDDSETAASLRVL